MKAEVKKGHLLLCLVTRKIRRKLITAGLEVHWRPGLCCPGLWPWCPFKNVPYFKIFNVCPSKDETPGITKWQFDLCIQTIHAWNNEKAEMKNGHLTLCSITCLSAQRHIILQAGPAVTQGPWSMLPWSWPWCHLKNFPYFKIYN